VSEKEEKKERTKSMRRKWRGIRERMWTRRRMKKGERKLKWWRKAEKKSGREEEDKEEEAEKGGGSGENEMFRIGKEKTKGMRREKSSEASSCCALWTKSEQDEGIRGRQRKEIQQDRR
jgi:hypothetical protein